MDIQQLESAAGKIEYCIIGKGSPVLFIHGGHSNCRETLFHEGFDLEQFQLITPSRPGYGRTPLDTHRGPSETASGKFLISVCNGVTVKISGPGKASSARKRITAMSPDSYFSISRRQVSIQSCFPWVKTVLLLISLHCRKIREARIDRDIKTANNR